MAPRWAVAIVVVLAVAGVVTPVIATSAIDDRAEQRDPFEPLPSNATGVNDTMGSQITAFMQSSAVAVNNSVETGLWVDQFNASTNRTRMVDRRATVLERRLERLRTELNETNATNITDPADARRLAALRARIDALNSTLQRTERAASEAGVNTTRLERLRDNASRLHGHNVARMARNLTTVGPPADAGPPDNRGPPGHPPGHAENGTHGPPTDSGENRTHGPPTNQSPGQSGNRTHGPPTNNTTRQANDRGSSAGGLPDQGTPTNGQSPDQSPNNTHGQSPDQSPNNTHGQSADTSPSPSGNATQGSSSDRSENTTETNGSNPSPPETGTETPDGSQPGNATLSEDWSSDRLID